MTTITVSKKGRRYSVKCEGHATGSNEVCAAISAISLGLALYISAENIKINHSRVADGFFELIFTGSKKAQHAYDMAVVCYRALGEEYPEYCGVYIDLDK